MRPRSASPRHSPRSAAIGVPSPTRLYEPSSLLNAACFGLFGVLLWLLAAQAEDDRKARQGIQISKTEYGEDWPFTVPQGYLKCVGTGVVVFASGGAEYALNGAAETGGYAPIEAIGKITNVPGAARINIWSILDRGLNLCKAQQAAPVR